MAVHDYRKHIAKVKAWDKASRNAEKLRSGDIERVRKIAIGVEEKLRKDSIVWKGYYKHLFDLNEQWYKQAEPIAKLQDELKKAEKAKNKAEISKLKKQIGQLDAKAQKLVDRFNKSFNELDKIDSGLKKIIKALESLQKV